MNNSTDSVFGTTQVGEQEAALIDRFLNGNDFSPNTRRAFATDLDKFSNWFVQANKELAQDQPDHNERRFRFP